MTVMQDQMLGGVIMWIPGSMMYIMAALVLIARLVRAEEEKFPSLESKRLAGGTARTVGVQDNNTSTPVWEELG
jgi:cytochrome c oxidase assembly factor CtaG